MDASSATDSWQHPRRGPVRTQAADALTSPAAVQQRAISREEAGRTLYGQRATVLPGLGQPPAPEWEELEDSVRARWCDHAETALVVEGQP